MPDSALVHLFKLLAPAERQAVIPQVCRRFRALANTPSALWEQVHLAFPADFQQTMSMAHLYAFFVRREGAVRSLHVEMSTAAAWPAVAAVLGVVGRGLQHLRIAGDTQECQVPGCTAPWLELAPKLESLELDDCVDHSIAEARFPEGAQHTPACAGPSARMRVAPATLSGAAAWPGRGGCQRRHRGCGCRASAARQKRWRCASSAAAAGTGQLLVNMATAPSAARRPRRQPCSPMNEAG